MRHKRRKRQAIACQTSGEITDRVARRARYLGSAEHKAYPSDAVEQSFPKYVWGWLHGDLYEARHINGPAGTYKGYKLLESEYPRDPMGRLKWGGAA